MTWQCNNCERVYATEMEKSSTFGVCRACVAEMAEPEPRVRRD